MKVSGAQDGGNPGDLPTDPWGEQGVRLQLPREGQGMRHVQPEGAGGGDARGEDGC